MRDRINKELISEALLMAVWMRKPPAGLIFHSDRGCQYCSEKFQKLLKTHQIICSMSRKGNCWDNAVAEAFFASLKIERAYWKTYRSRKQARADITDYIEMFYNSRRLHSYLGYLSPRDFEKMHQMKKTA